MRTEEEVLKDFEKLGYEITRKITDYNLLKFKKPYILYAEKIFKLIFLNLDTKEYYCYESHYATSIPLTMEEHKLIHELFEIWQWI